MSYGWEESAAEAERGEVTGLPEARQVLKERWGCVPQALVDKMGGEG